MQDSIYYHKPGHFREFIRVITDKSISVSEALATFREVKCLPNKFKQMTVHELSKSPVLIQELYETLRKRMQPESKYKLPYNKAEREKQLIDNIAENYAIDKEKAQAKVITGHHNDGTREFNYALEVVIAPRTDLDEKHAGEVEFIGSINSTPSIDGGEGYFQGYPYRWLDKKGNTRDATSVNDILHECGFNTSSYHTAKKRFPCVVAINLRTPVPDWLGSAGKTKIDLKPYADEIAKTVVNLANKIPSYHGKKHTVFNFSFSRETPAILYLEDFLKERYNKIQANPSLKITDKITQSGVWYRIRPIMVEDDFKPRKTWGDTRKGLTSKINEMCQQLFGLNREELGIIAGTRATMLYEGKSYPVEIDNVEELATKGIAIIIIEKEGIADLLAPFAERYRVALVHTRGRFTEYGKDLIEAAKKAGSVVGILVDYDTYGEEIAKGSRTNTPKIGITRDTIKWLQQNGYPDLIEAEIEEEYSPAIYIPRTSI